MTAVLALLPSGFLDEHLRKKKALMLSSKRGFLPLLCYNFPSNRQAVAARLAADYKGLA